VETHPSRGDSVLATPGEIFELVRTGQATSRSELGRLTGMSRTAIGARVNVLADAGYLLTGSQLASTGGRPAGSLAVNDDAGIILAAAIGRSRAQLAAFDLSGRELAGASLDHEVGSGPEAVMPRVAERLKALTEGIKPPVMGLGLSLPGTVDPVGILSVDSPVLGWTGAPLSPYLEDLGPTIPKFLGNDAEVIARSERLGAVGNYHDLVVVKASTGLGLGIVAAGQLITGHLGGSGGIGHTKVAAAAGLRCRCGDDGCLETLAGGWALVSQFNEAGHQVEHVRDLVAAAVAGDATARRLLRESGRQLGELLAVVINVLNPRAVVIGGDMASAFDLYAAGVRESVYALAGALTTRELQFLPATFGDRAGVVGCAAMVLDQVLSPKAVDARVNG